MLASTLPSRPDRGANAELSRLNIVFIPELSLRSGPEAVSAWLALDAKPKAVMVNYLDLPHSRGNREKSLARLNDQLSSADGIILSCIGRDRELDRLSIDDYHRSAIALNARAVVTPDDYIYANDSKFPNYQWYHLGRAASRMETLVKLSDRSYDIIGLIFGEPDHQRVLLHRLLEHNVREVAFPCGDLLKQGSLKKCSHIVGSFVSLAHSANVKTLLTGVDSRRLLLRVLPDHFSTSAWAFEAYHKMNIRGEVESFPDSSRLNSSDVIDCQLRRLRALHDLGIEIGRFNHGR